MSREFHRDTALYYQWTCEELKVFIEIVGKNISRLWSNVFVPLVINEMHPNWLRLDQAGKEFLDLLWKWVCYKFSPYKNVIYQVQIKSQGIRYLFLFDKEGNLDANSSQTKYCQHTQRSWLSNNITITTTTKRKHRGLFCSAKFWTVYVLCKESLFWKKTLLNELSCWLDNKYPLT